MSVSARAGRRRQEGAEKVRGATRFTADLEMAGMLHVRLVLSPIASGRIASVDVKVARAAPGVVDVVTGEDLPELETPGPELPLARGRVFYSGQPVAAVIAESEAAAADAALLVEVEYEEMAAVVDPARAIDDGSPAVLEEAESASEDDASVHGASTANEEEPTDRPRNTTGVVSNKRGDVDAALKQAHTVVRGVYTIGRAHHSFMEPHVSIVRPEPDGGLTIWSPTQGPFALRDDIAKLLNVRPHLVRVVPMPVGGGFGGKVELLEPLLALLAVRTRRPVRLVLDRSNEFLVGHHAPDATFEIELGATADGTLTALRARFRYDNGATAGWHAGISSSFLTGTYQVANSEIHGLEIVTNKTPADAYRAPGATQTYFALESAMDELAQALDMDPIELRLRNVVREAGSVEVLEEARRHPAYSSPSGDGEAIGVALGMWGGARTPSAAGCRVEPDGSLAITVGSPDISGSATGLALIAAETFGVAPEKVRVQVADTSTAPYAAMSTGSQVTYSLGGAVIEAAREARRQLLEVAGEELEAAADDLDIVDGRVQVKGAPGKSIEITELVRMSTEFAGRYRPLQAIGRSAVLEASPMFTVHIARVRADRETGAFQLTGYGAIQDVGRAINPPEAEGQIHGGAVQALGRALGEGLVYDADGNLRTGSFLDYELPAADQIPDIGVRLVEVPSQVGPLGARGVGEPPAIPGTAALANAVSRAFGVRVRSVPIDRWELISPSGPTGHLPVNGEEQANGE